VFHTQHEGQPVRINYVRYLNQYLLAVDGPKEVAVDIDRLIADHIRSKLLLDVAAIEEEQPVCIEKEPVEFLDFRLTRVEKLGNRVAAQVGGMTGFVWAWGGCWVECLGCRQARVWRSWATGWLHRWVA
jgi:hypothetical protein